MTAFPYSSPPGVHYPEWRPLTKLALAGSTQITLVDGACRGDKNLPVTIGDQLVLITPNHFEVVNVYAISGTTITLHSPLKNEYGVSTKVANANDFTDSVSKSIARENRVMKKVIKEVLNEMDEEETATLGQGSD
jgi:hypothetical protein